MLITLELLLVLVIVWHFSLWLQQGMSNSRVVSTSKTLNCAYVTGGIGYKPNKGLKWKGKKTVIQQELPI